MSKLAVYVSDYDRDTNYSTIKVSEPMSFTYDASTNVALPLFGPEYANQYVAFDVDGLMNVQTYYNDLVNPPTDEDAVRVLYRWYACTTDYVGYTYPTLNWVLGKYPPENPTCVKVQVKREFLK